jgi:Tfp pilus assembly protein PilO
MKASSVVKNAVNVSQRGWQKLSASDWRKHIKLVVFMLVAVIIVSMQVINSSPNSPFFGS